VATACAAAVGPVTLWAAPDETHPAFQALGAQHGVTLASQDDGDLGARMLAAVAAAAGPCPVIGTDCPAPTTETVRNAADIVGGGSDVVIIPADDGGYVLIGMRKAQPALLSDMRWSTPGVMDETRRRLRQLGLAWQEPVTLWDVDVPGDLERLREVGL